MGRGVQHSPRRTEVLCPGHTGTPQRGMQGTGPSSGVGPAIHSAPGRGPRALAVSMSDPPCPDARPICTKGAKDGGLGVSGIRRPRHTAVFSRLGTSEPRVCVGRNRAWGRSGRPGWAFRTHVRPRFPRGHPDVRARPQPSESAGRGAPCRLRDGRAFGSPSSADRGLAKVCARAPLTSWAPQAAWAPAFPSRPAPWSPQAARG
jgi:hypothetical protein